jgi:hypothetical protein
MESGKRKNEWPIRTCSMDMIRACDCGCGRWARYGSWLSSILGLKRLLLDGIGHLVTLCIDRALIRNDEIATTPNDVRPLQSAHNRARPFGITTEMRGVGIVALETNFALLEYQSLDYHKMYDRLRA